MGFDPEIIQLGVNPEIMGVNPEIIQLGVNPEIISNRHLTPHHLLFPIVSLLNLILLFYSAPSLWSYRITFLYWTNSSLSMCFISIAFVTRYFTVDYFRWVFCCWSSASVFQYFQPLHCISLFCVFLYIHSLQQSFSFLTCMPSAYFYTLHFCFPSTLLFKKPLRYFFF